MTAVGPVTFDRLTAHCRVAYTILLRCAMLCMVASAISSCTKSSGRAGFRVGLVTPGSIADAAWNSGAFAGLTQIKDSLAVATSHVEARTPAEQEEALRTYAA